MEKLQALRMTYLAWALGEVIEDRFFDLLSFINNKKIKLLDPRDVVNKSLEEVVNQLVNGSPECGTTACALGWCPRVFPLSWKFDKEFMPELIGEDGVGQGQQNYREREAVWFGVDINELEWLFYWRSGNRTAKEESYVLKAMLDKHGYNYADLVEEARDMFGRDLTVSPVCPTEQVGTAEPAPETWDEDGQ